MADLHLSTVGWLVMGVVGGAALLIYSKSFGRARRKVLANGLLIVALLYVLFALRIGPSIWLLYELLGVGIFGLFAWLGVNRGTSWLAVGWVLHPLWDAGLHFQGPGSSFAPEWYVVACISFDLLVGVVIQLKRREL